MGKLNRAAFSKDDVADAKRSHPDFYPRDYAARPGTRELLGQSTRAESPEAVSAGESLLLVVRQPADADPSGHRSLPAPSGTPARANDGAALSDANLA